MFFRKNKMKEAYMTNSAELYGLALQAIRSGNIRFETKTINIGTQNRKSGELWGTLGENTNLQIIYYIYVNEKDLELSQHLINEQIRKRNQRG